MSDWNTLLQAALVGTDRPWALSAAATPVDPVMQLLRDAHAAAKPDDPGQLLRLAGALAACRQAGWVAPQAVTAPQAIAAVETRTLANPPWINLLSQSLTQGPLRLQLQVLHEMNHANLYVSPKLLPELLHWGRQSVEARLNMLPVLGERGRWLAAHNPDWSYACGVQEQADTQHHWAHGSLAQRCAVLQDERAHAPDKARERLAADWRSLPAKERTALIQTLRVGLCPEDEAFLSTQLKDRAQDVRHEAAQLLSSLPDSAYSQRMSARMRPLVGLSIKAPTKIDADWKDDQLEVERPTYGSWGERAWWLYQLTRHTPLTWWTTHTGLDPAAIIAMAKNSDWSKALLGGWIHVVLMQPDVVWCEALLRETIDKNGRLNASLLGLLTPAQREKFHLDRMKHADGLADLSDVMASCLAGCAAHEQLGQDLSNRLVVLLRKKFKQRVRPKYGHYTLYGQLPDLACALHPQAFQALLDLPHHADETASESECIASLAQILHHRHTLFTLTV